MRTPNACHPSPPATCQTQLPGCPRAWWANAASDTWAPRNALTTTAMIRTHPGRRDGKVSSRMAARYDAPRGLGAVGVGAVEVGALGIGIPAAPLPRPAAGGVGPGPPGAPPLPDVVVSMRPAIIPEADPARRKAAHAAMAVPAPDSTG